MIRWNSTRRKRWRRKRRQKKNIYTKYVGNEFIRCIIGYDDKEIKANVLCADFVILWCGPPSPLPFTNTHKYKCNTTKFVYANYDVKNSIQCAPLDGWMGAMPDTSWKKKMNEKANASRSEMVWIVNSVLCAPVCIMKKAQHNNNDSEISHKGNQMLC